VLRTEPITHSERVAIGEAIEAELQGRNHRPAESPENFPELPKGDTRDLAAKAAGFGNGLTSVQHLFNDRSTFVETLL
jgi:ParB family chromosome partitioning protein